MSIAEYDELLSAPPLPQAVPLSITADIEIESIESVETLEAVVTTETQKKSVTTLSHLPWVHILAISIFWLALNLHWAALSIIILPSEVFKMVGELHKGEALALVLVPGAFVSLLANPFFGFCSDRTCGKLARWGRRRPYIVVGTLVNVAGLIWMATATNILSLALAYSVVQFSNNAATAPFHALLPDIVPERQRGFASGMMGLLAIIGSIGGVIVAGLFVDASKPLFIYQHGLWLTYSIIIVVLIALMIVTLLTVKERRLPLSLHNEQVQETIERASLSVLRANAPRRRVPSALKTVVGTLVVMALAWGVMLLWNSQQIMRLPVSSDVQQVVLEVIATIGILRLFDFNPRRDRDFAWVLVTRLVMMLGIYIVQDFLQYFMRDVVHAAHPEAQTTNFIILLALSSLVSALTAGWLSDYFGRKRMVYCAGALMALAGCVVIVTHALTFVLIAGAIFGLGYGAYTSVDWALVADVLPSAKNFARDMGVWNISLSLPQVIAPVLGGPLIDSFTRAGHPVLGFQLLFAMAIVYCLVGTVTVRYIKGVRR